MRVSLTNLSIMILTTIVSYIQEKKRNNQTMSKQNQENEKYKTVLLSTLSYVVIIYIWFSITFLLLHTQVCVLFNV